MVIDHVNSEIPLPQMLPSPYHGIEYHGQTSVTIDQLISSHFYLIINFLSIHTVTFSVSNIKTKQHCRFFSL